MLSLRISLIMPTEKVKINYKYARGYIGTNQKIPIAKF